MNRCVYKQSAQRSSLQLVTVREEEDNETEDKYNGDMMTTTMMTMMMMMHVKEWKW